MIKWAVVLLFTQACFAETASSYDEVEEGISYSYPFFYADEDSFSSKGESKDDSSKEESPAAWHGTIGKAKVTIDVENTDFLSQCQAKWDSLQEKNKPEKKKGFRFKDDEDEEEKEDHSPKVSASIKWSADN